MHGDSAVVGGADHGLHEIELRGGAAGAPLRRRRELYTRAHGHSEWVTDVAHLPDGRVVSAGMDSKLCVWNAAGAPRCAELLGHTGSVSAVRVSADGALAVSASYDKSLRVWPLGGGGGGGTPLRAHRAPVLQLVFEGDVLASADRDGAVVAWDLGRGAAATALGRHGGHATALATDGGEALLSGGQDGVVRLWDLRAASQAVETSLHGAGAVNELVHHRLPSGQPLVLSAGADGVVLALEPRKSLAALHRFADHHDFVYSLKAIGDYCCSGGGDGMLLVHDLATGGVLYGLGANRAAVRAIHCEAGRLVAAGDDGTLIAYDFGAGVGEAALPRRTAPAAGRRAPSPPRGSRAGKPLSAAQQFAEKKRLAMERAARIKAERQAAQAATQPQSDQLDFFMAQGQGGMPGAPPRDAPSELDQLHAMGDAKFGRPRRR